MRTHEQEPIETKNMPYSVRPMLPEDSKAVAAIEMEAFPTTWPPTPFRKELNNRLARYLVAYIHSQEATDSSFIKEGLVPMSEGYSRIINQFNNYPSKENYKSIVNTCINCHISMCPGPLERIDNLITKIHHND